jgi:hypothetical protein
VIRLPFRCISLASVAGFFQAAETLKIPSILAGVGWSWFIAGTISGTIRYF